MAGTANAASTALALAGVGASILGAIIDSAEAAEPSAPASGYSSVDPAIYEAAPDMAPPHYRPDPYGQTITGYATPAPALIQVSPPASASRESSDGSIPVLVRGKVNPQAIEQLRNSSESERKEALDSITSDSVRRKLKAALDREGIASSEDQKEQNYANRKINSAKNWVKKNVNKVAKAGLSAVNAAEGAGAKASNIASDPAIKNAWPYEGNAVIDKAGQEADKIFKEAR